MNERYDHVLRAMAIHSEAMAACVLCCSGSIPVHNKAIGWTHIDTGDSGGDACAAPLIWDKLFDLTTPEG